MHSSPLVHFLTQQCRRKRNQFIATVFVVVVDSIHTRAESEWEKVDGKYSNFPAILIFIIYYFRCGLDGNETRAPNNAFWAEVGNRCDIIFCAYVARSCCSVVSQHNCMNARPSLAKHKNANAEESASLNSRTAPHSENVTNRCKNWTASLRYEFMALLFCFLPWQMAPVERFHFAFFLHMTDNTRYIFR